MSRFYEPIVKKNVDHLLDAPAIVLANLCVSYIMTSLVRRKGVGGKRARPQSGWAHGSKAVGRTAPKRLGARPQSGWAHGSKTAGLGGVGRPGAPDEEAQGISVLQNPMPLHWALPL